MNKIRKLTIGAQLGLGFGIILVLLTVVGAFSFFGLNHAADGFSEYRGLARDTNLAGRLQAQMLMVRRSHCAFETLPPAIPGVKDLLIFDFTRRITVSFLFSLGSVLFVKYPGNEGK